MLCPRGIENRSIGTGCFAEARRRFHGAEALRRKAQTALDRETLNKRTSLIEQGDYSDPMFDYAKQFASADTIVIAAPYWDLSFPAMLKTYIENIYVTGIVSAYDESGMPVGLCKAKELYYVTTAGGPYDPTYSYGYIESLAKNYFGIPKTHLVKAEMLDIIGNDAEEILNQEVSRIFGNAIL